MNENKLFTQNSERRAMRLPEVCLKTGLSKSTIWNKVNPDSKYYDASFPKRFKIGGNSVAWSADEVDAWLEAQMQARQQGENHKEKEIEQ